MKACDVELEKMNIKLKITVEIRSSGSHAHILSSVAGERLLEHSYAPLSQWTLKRSVVDDERIAMMTNSTGRRRMLNF